MRPFATYVPLILSFRSISLLVCSNKRRQSKLEIMDMQFLRSDSDAGSMSSRKFSEADSIAEQDEDEEESDEDDLYANENDAAGSADEVWEVVAANQADLDEPGGKGPAVSSGRRAPRGSSRAHLTRARGASQEAVAYDAYEDMKALHEQQQAHDARQQQEYEEEEVRRQQQEYAARGAKGSRASMAPAQQQQERTREKQEARLLQQEAKAAARLQKEERQQQQQQQQQEEEEEEDEEEAEAELTRQQAQHDAFAAGAIHAPFARGSIHDDLGYQRAVQKVRVINPPVLSRSYCLSLLSGCFVGGGSGRVSGGHARERPGRAQGEFIRHRMYAQLCMHNYVCTASHALRSIQALMNKEEQMLRKALRGGAKHDVDVYVENLSAVVEKQLEQLNALKAKLGELSQGLSEELTMSRRPPR
jgi:hypothetical protein